MQQILYLVFFQLIGCTNTNSKGSAKDSRVYKGQIRGVQDCDFSINIDVLEAGNTEPLLFTKARPNGDFDLTIPTRISTAPLSIHGFCYNNKDDLEDNIRQWSTEPFLLLSTHDVSTPIVIRLATGKRNSEQAIQEEIPTEYSTWVLNPLLVEFYGLRFPEHELTTSGSQPEIKQGGLSTETRRTHIATTLDFIKTNSSPIHHSLLLPSVEQLNGLRSDLDPLAISVQIIEQQLQSACAALVLHCPSANLLRQQEWILKDKNVITTPKLTQQRATLWLRGHRLIQHVLQNQQEVPSGIPLPTELALIANTDDALQVQQRLNLLYEEYGLKTNSLH